MAGSAAIVAAPAGVSFAGWRDYLALLKPRVMSLVVFSAACALWTAPGHINGFPRLRRDPLHRGRRGRCGRA